MAAPKPFGSWRPKLDKAAAKRITADWLSAFPGFGVARSLLLARRIGPLVQGVLLDRESSNRYYRPCLFLHHLTEVQPTFGLGLNQPLRTRRTHAPESISVLSHDERWRDAAERLKAASYLPVPGPVTLEQVLSAYRAIRSERFADPIPITDFEDVSRLLCWAGLQERAESFLRISAEEMKGFRPQFWPPERIAEWQRRMEQEISSAAALRAIAEAEAVKLKVTELPQVDLLLPDVVAQ